MFHNKHKCSIKVHWAFISTTSFVKKFSIFFSLQTFPIFLILFFINFSLQFEFQKEKEEITFYEKWFTIFKDCFEEEIIYQWKNLYTIYFHGNVHYMLWKITIFLSSWKCANIIVVYCRILFKCTIFTRHEKVSNPPKMSQGNLKWKFCTFCAAKNALCVEEYGNQIYAPLYCKVLKAFYPPEKIIREIAINLGSWHLSFSFLCREK